MVNSNMSEEEILEHGYKEFGPTSFDGDGVEKCFQKRFDDKIGKKYFITIRKWQGWTHPYTGDVSPAGYEASVQLCSADTEIRYLCFSMRHGVLRTLRGMLRLYFRQDCFDTMKNGRIVNDEFSI